MAMCSCGQSHLHDGELVCGSFGYVDAEGHDLYCMYCGDKFPAGGGAVEKRADVARQARALDKLEGQFQLRVLFAWGEVLSGFSFSRNKRVRAKTLLALAEALREPTPPPNGEKE